jgi:plastocyanin
VNLDPVGIVLTEEGFEPREIHITKGTKVTFTTTRQNQFWPASNLHPSHEIYPEFDPKYPLEPTESWSFVFDKPGVWRFHDHIRSYFTGTIYVDE